MALSKYEATNPGSTNTRYMAEKKAHINVANIIEYIPKSQRGKNDIYS